MRSEFDSAAEARVIPFRRRSSAPKRKRRSVWVRLLAPLGAAVVAVATPCGAVVWVLHSARFALVAVEVEAQRGETHPGPANSQAAPAPSATVTASWVAAALHPLVGRNLPSLDLGEVEQRLAGHPWIGHVEARKELPRRLLVRVRERVPVAILQRGTALFYLDGSGVVIAPVDPQGAEADLFFVRLPASRAAGLHADRAADDGVEAPPASLALRVAEEFRAAHPVWGRGLSEVEVLSDEDCRVVTEELDFPVLVKAGRVAAGLERLRGLLPEIEKRYRGILAVDLRSPRRVVIQPRFETLRDQVAARPSSGEPIEVNERPVAGAAGTLASMRRNF